MENKECVICFEPNEKIIFCNDEKCNLVFCLECCEFYFKECLTQKIIPKCTQSNSYFVSKNLENFQTLLNLYTQCCVSHFDFNINSESDIISEDLSRKILIKQKRFENFGKKVPTAIFTVINFLYKEELLSNIDDSENIKTKNEIFCFKEKCRGMLDSVYMCSVCKNSFCEKCEQIKNQNHICNKDEIESIKLKNSFVSCPKCGVKSIKNGGCNFLTCAYCKQNYHIDGYVSSSGGHSKIIKKYPDIEKLKIIVKSESKYLNTLKIKKIHLDFIIRINPDRKYEKLFNLFYSFKTFQNCEPKSIIDKYIHYLDKKDKFKDYQKDISEILEKIQNKTITCIFMTSLYNKYKT
jgi:hypothetical protein